MAEIYKSWAGLALIVLLFCCLNAVLHVNATSLPSSSSNQTPQPSSLGLESEYYRFIDSTEQGVMARIGSMKSAVLALASAAMVKGQSSATSSGKADGLTSAATMASATIGTGTVGGTQTSYSVAFTVPAEADVGPNILPNIQNQTAVQAQAVCPGYKASGVEKTTNGFTAKLNLAGDPVSRLRMPADEESG